MELKILANNASQAVDKLKDDIGKDKTELIKKGLSEEDAIAVSAAKEVGSIEETENKLTANSICAIKLLQAFLNYTDDESEYIFEQEVKSRSTEMISYHFVQFFDEDVFHCYRTTTSYGIGTKSAIVNSFSIEEIIMDDESTDSLSDLVYYVNRKDKTFTEGFAKHILQQYEFASGGRSFVQRA